ncbi:2OG-Fe(II) oxygenase [Roseospira visakhapatnamensis]|uniref:2OG-Fe(II) oxygenase n=1 Tax=Roseospira visakhapatnamensis TaxID=390880 RepID=A0A7W6WB08_9PROT|nr:2OG-Fe(II) oxygenase [Roseospira visakhapatnamensis]MBB4267529.1 hypothetical protein [Roseospira visakhapatnamensis]
MDTSGHPENTPGTSDGVTTSVLASLAAAARHDHPFPYWRLTTVWPSTVLDALEALPVDPAAMTYAAGRREENNALRVYFDQAHQEAFSVCRRVAAALQDPRVVAAIQTLCGVDLSGTFLRVEYARDTDGFWLEPHTDIGVKRFTLLAPLSRGPEAGDWGTDVYADPKGPPLRLPFVANHATVFVPSERTWHGFARRPIHGVRRSLIVNYVGPEWRARHELCFPDRPVV